MWSYVSLKTLPLTLSTETRVKIDHRRSINLEAFVCCPLFPHVDWGQGHQTACFSWTFSPCFTRVFKCELHSSRRIPCKMPITQIHADDTWQIKRKRFSLEIDVKFYKYVLWQCMNTISNVLIYLFILMTMNDESTLDMLPRDS